MIDELPEMIGWVKGEEELFDFFVSRLFFFPSGTVPATGNRVDVSGVT